MPYAEIKCPHCSASGRVDNDSNSPFMMGRCPVCGGYVVYFCGASLGLEDGVIATHSLEHVRNHILSRIDDFLESRLTEFLQEYADEFEITCDDDRASVEVFREPPVEEGQAMPSVPALGEASPKPSVRQPALGRITEDEVRDFLNIDIHLIDRATHFRKHFGL